MNFLNVKLFEAGVENFFIIVFSVLKSFYIFSNLRAGLFVGQNILYNI